MFARSRKPPSTDHSFVLIWVLLISVVAFSAYVAQDRSLIGMMLAADRSYLSVLIVILFMGASCHAAWHILAVSLRLRTATALFSAETPDGVSASTGPSPFLSRFLREIGPRPPGDQDGTAVSLPNGDRDNILEIYADQLRSPVEIGWFVVDILIRLGLVGTIVGFILILQSLTEGPAPRGDDIRTLLISMSGGMGTALYTTLAGLISATLLGIQYMILSRSVEHLIGALVRLGQRCVPRSP